MEYAGHRLLVLTEPPLEGAGSKVGAWGGVGGAVRQGHDQPGSTISLDQPGSTSPLMRHPLGIRADKGQG